MHTKSSLSAPRKLLLETLQAINYGRIERLLIRAGEPVLDHLELRIVKDVKLGSMDIGARSELEANDFVLKREHIQLFETINLIDDGVIESVDVKGGLPFRLCHQQDLQDLIRKT